MSVRFTGDIIPAQYVERLSDALQGAGLYGFYTLGGAVTVSSGLTVNVAAMGLSTFIVNGTLNTAAYTASTVTLGAAHATLARIDIVKVTSAGAVAVTAGTAAASPVPPNIAAGDLHLAQINVAAAQTTLASGDITDMRQVLPLRRVVIRKSADETVTTSTTLQNDDELLWAIPISTNWIAKLAMYVTTPAAAQFKFTVTVPSGATLLVTGVGVGGGDAEGGWLETETTRGIRLTTSGTAISMQHTNSTAWVVEATIAVEHGGNAAGNVQVQWAQLASSGSTVVKEGSSLIAQQVA